MGSHLLLMIGSTLVLVYSHGLCFSNKILPRFVQSTLVLHGDEFTASDKEVPVARRMLCFLDNWAGSDDAVAISLRHKWQWTVREVGCA